MSDQNQNTAPAQQPQQQQPPQHQQQQQAKPEKGKSKGTPVGTSGTLVRFDS